MVHIFSSCNSIGKIWCIFEQVEYRLRLYGAYFFELSLVHNYMRHILATCKQVETIWCILNHLVFLLKKYGSNWVGCYFKVFRLMATKRSCEYVQPQIYGFKQILHSEMSDLEKIRHLLFCGIQFIHMKSQCWNRHAGFCNPYSSN